MNENDELWMCLKIFKTKVTVHKQIFIAVVILSGYVNIFLQLNCIMLLFVNKT